MSQEGGGGRSCGSGLRCRLERSPCDTIDQPVGYGRSWPGTACPLLSANEQRADMTTPAAEVRHGTKRRAGASGVSRKPTAPGSEVAQPDAHGMRADAVTLCEP